MKRKLSLFLALMMMAALLAGCAGNNGGTTEPTPATTGGSTATQATTAATEAPTSSEPSRSIVRRASTEAFNTTDPHYQVKSVDMNLNDLIYESFYYINVKLDEYPRLATGYEVSEDGLTYTYYLKEGVPFQTGGEMTSSDVKYSFERANGSPNYMTYTKSIASIDTPDDYTVVFHLSDVDPIFHINACKVGVLSEAAMQGIDNGFTTELPGGTGPYTLQEWRGDEKIVLKRNENYHGDAPAIETIEWIILGDETAATMAFESGQVDYANIPKADWERILNSGNFTTTLIYYNHTTYLIMNCQKAPFDDVRVRQAFNYAIRQDEVLTAAMEDLGMTAHFLGHPDLMFGLPPYDEVTVYDYNPEKAKALLAEAGYPDGLTLDGSCWTNGNAAFNTVAEVIQSQLAEIGVIFDVEIIDSSVYVTDMINGNHLMGMMGIGFDIDAGYFSRAFTTDAIGDLNMSYYSNARVDECFDQASKTADKELRKEAFKEAFQIITEEAAILPFYQQASCIAWNLELNADPYTLMSTWSWK